MNAEFAKDAGQRARDFNLFNVPDDYFEAPYPYFRQLRDHDPIHTNSDGSVLVTRYRDVRQVWRDPGGRVNKSKMFSAKFGEGPLLEHHTTSLLFRDPPDHKRLRAVLLPAFAPREMARLQEFMDRTVANLLDELEEKKEIDFVSEFAFRLPVAVICSIFGVPVEDGDRIQAIGRRILFPLNPSVSADVIESGHSAVVEFKDYLKEYVMAARGKSDKHLESGLIRILVESLDSGAPLSENELLHLCILVLNGGHETTTNLIAGSLNALLDDPDALAALRDGKTGPAPFEELLRFVTPLQLQGRRTTTAIELESGLIEPDTEVVICQSSANRDERIFEDPDRLNLDRAPNPHVAFGAGAHACVGQPLARLEVAAALPPLLRRFRRIERTQPVRYNPNVRFRGISELRIRAGR